VLDFFRHRDPCEAPARSFFSNTWQTDKFLKEKFLYYNKVLLGKMTVNRQKEVRRVYNWRVQIPRHFCKALGISEYDYVTLELNENNEIILRKAEIK